MRTFSRRAALGAAQLALAAALIGATPLGVRAQGLPVADPESVGLSPQRLARLSAVIRKDVAEGKIPGGVMLVARHGKVAYLQAFGVRDKASGAPMRTDALFRLGSMTKPFTLVAAMMLIEEGRFKLDTPVAEILPQFADVRVGVEKPDPKTGRVALDLVPPVRPILVIDLLRHTSGLTYEISGEGKVKDLYREAGIGKPGETAAEIVDKLAKLPLMYQPGTVWEYGRSVDVLGRIVEVVSGMGLREFLERLVLGPLGVNDTAFWVPPEKQDRITSVELGPPGTPQRELTDLTVPTHGEAGGTGLVSTASDYARLLQMLLNGGTLDGVRLLDRKSVELMTSNQLDGNVRTKGPSYYPGPGYGYGFGFAVCKAEGKGSDVGKAGNYHIEGVYNTFAFVDPKQDLLAVLMVQAMKWIYYRPVVKELVLGSIVN